ncbi:MAG: hypothetical protein HQ588_00825 [Deltaproteobacteria bacterium]|nr:hypothetical protein [Deltaproteobacteria bacterium]
MARLQKRAWYSLAIGVIWAIAIIVVFIAKGGVTAYTEDQGMRVILAALLIGGLLAYFIMMRLTLRKPGQVDERDRLIMGRAPVVQLWAVFISLAVWSISLTEIYWDQGQIPVIFPYLVFMSLFIINVLAQSIGILFGYWKISRYG